MAWVTISQTWADGSSTTVQVGNQHNGYPDELHQLRTEAVAAFNELVSYTDDTNDGTD